MSLFTKTNEYRCSYCNSRNMSVAYIVNATILRCHDCKKDKAI